MQTIYLTKMKTLIGIVTGVIGFASCILAAENQQISQPKKGGLIRSDLDGDGVEDTVTAQANGVAIKIHPEDTWHVLPGTQGMGANYATGEFFKVLPSANEIICWNTSGFMRIYALAKRGNADDLLFVSFSPQIFNPSNPGQKPLNALTQLDLIDFNGDGSLDIMGYWALRGQQRVALSPYPSPSPKDKKGSRVLFENWDCPVPKSAVNNGNLVYFFQENSALVRAEFNLRAPSGVVRKYWIGKDGFRAMPDLGAPILTNTPFLP